MKLGEEKKEEIERERAFLTKLLETKATIVHTKIKERERCVVFILDENSIQTQGDVRLLLEKEATPRFKLVRDLYRFPIEGMVSPPQRMTMTIQLTFHPPKPMGLLEMTFYHLLVIAILLLIQHGLSLTQHTVFSKGDLSFSGLILACCSVLHILFTVLWRDTRAKK